ncbi:MAG TPA: ABC transporter ATP-binding protein [Povalibacter sp.]|uniref:ABC transporter ATP-binding protein n=1 Tax=Povalibacter sp. TaxID=1962978 RepID=UPI002C22975A|nr:ABC transporter ATP-binding protein [Povalibacter sp.]HMN47279.1 ABC transporter ATP-binding protein [Povalibacter sp.]
MPEPLIALSEVQKIYRTDRMETVALQAVSLTIDPGEFVSIMGPSGCGKSTLLNVLGLIDKPTRGAVTFAGRAVSGLGDAQLAPIRNQELGFVFQSFHLIPDLRVIDNVELPLFYRKGAWRERRRLALEALAVVGLANRVNHFPTELSGGQQQRVAIARAIVGKPSLLLADEPTGNLDSQMSEEIMGLLERLNTEQGTTIIMVTHDQAKADRTRRIFRLFDGQLVH